MTRFVLRPGHAGRALAFALSAATLAPIVAVTLAPKPAYALIVFDPKNYTENLLSAARALEQINNQITSLQNEAQMLINQARNLTSLPTSLLSDIEGNFSEMKSLLGEAEQLAYNVQNIDSQFSATYQDLPPARAATNWPPRPVSAGSSRCRRSKIRSRPALSRSAASPVLRPRPRNSSAPASRPSVCSRQPRPATSCWRCRPSRWLI